MVNIMVQESAKKLIFKVPLSNNTISLRIYVIVIEFGLQLDEATDSNTDAHHICNAF